MLTGNFVDLTSVITGLTALELINGDAAVVVMYPYVHIPEILWDDVPAPVKAALSILGWGAHPSQGGAYWTLAPPP